MYMLDNTSAPGVTQINKSLYQTVIDFVHWPVLGILTSGISSNFQIKIQLLETSRRLIRLYLMASMKTRPVYFDPVSMVT